METPTLFEWDEVKAARNLAKHGADFDIVGLVFSDPDRVDADVCRHQHGESRRKVIGAVGDRLFTAIYTMRGANCRMISVRRANTKEGRLYGDHSQDDG